jgi:hypothetical protein
MSSVVRFVGTVVLVSAAFGVVACGKKADECNAVIGAYNNGAGTVHTIKEDDPQVTSKLAAAYTKTAGDLGKLELTTPELKTIATKMQSAATAAAAAANDVSQAADKDAAASKVAPLIDAVNASVKELQTFCGVDEKK